MSGDQVPISEKFALTVPEAIAYFGIGRDTLYRLTKNPTAKFVLRIGRITLIKRAAFEAYLNSITDLAAVS